MRKRNKKIIIKKRFVTNIALIFAVILISNIAFNGVSGKKEYKTSSITINSNDTLWNIARKICKENTNLNINKVIYEIKEINNMETSNISVGQSLEIPIYQ